MVLIDLFKQNLLVTSQQDDLSVFLEYSFYIQDSLQKQHHHEIWALTVEDTVKLYPRSSCNCISSQKMLDKATYHFYIHE